MSLKNHLKSGVVYLGIFAGCAGIGWAAAQLPHWLKPNYTTGNFTALHSRFEEPVILFGTSWCPYCAKTRKLLQEHKIPFHEINVEGSDVERADYKKMNAQSIPVLVIGDRKIDGYRPEAILEAYRHLQNS
ncbi:glutaredoxin family protein [Gallaecimonas kandeliae]|uniref:glutaredoxin family protein n=1 Tax=Gallaecimonas kandeliae TaxID=3029055 RepID=UPI0026496DEE|nr:glutaredoxin family protein [Gallaecimonas kandeliae]WKE65144.1 glutaredoxin family protein [Gallaecimonas kandeliae]